MKTLAEMSSKLVKKVTELNEKLAVSLVGKVTGEQKILPKTCYGWIHEAK